MTVIKTSCEIFCRFYASVFVSGRLKLDRIVFVIDESERSADDLVAACGFSGMPS